MIAITSKGWVGVGWKRGEEGRKERSSILRTYNYKRQHDTVRHDTTRDKNKNKKSILDSQDRLYQ